MKNMFKNTIGLFLLLSIGSGWAQVADQNPNFEESMDMYMQQKDSLLHTLGTTPQQTYKAHDWYEAREERRALRKAYRHQERMNRSYYYGYASPYYSYYPNYYNYTRWLPSIGFRAGDFWFSF